jgi:hypothetical protein
MVRANDDPGPGFTTDKSKSETKDKGISRNATEYERVGSFSLYKEK